MTECSPWHIACEIWTTGADLSSVRCLIFGQSGLGRAGTVEWQSNDETERLIRVDVP